MTNVSHSPRNNQYWKSYLLFRFRLDRSDGKQPKRISKRRSFAVECLAPLIGIFICRYPLLTAFLCSSFSIFFSILAYSFSRIIHISITQHAFRFVELLTSCIWRNAATTWWNKWWMKRKRSSKKVEFWILSWRAKQQNNTIINIPRIMNEQKMNQIEHNNCCFSFCYLRLCKTTSCYFVVYIVRSWNSYPVCNRELYVFFKKTIPSKSACFANKKCSTHTRPPGCYCL